MKTREQEQYDLEDLTAKGYRILAVDSQIVSTISQCEKRAELRFLKHLELIEEDKADYLDRGDLMHTALKIYYTLKKRTDKFTYNDRVEAAVSLCRKKAVTLDIDALESEEYITNFIAYADYWHNKKAESWIPVEVEQPFSVILYVSHEYKLVLIYEGVIDLIVEGFGEGNFNIVDHKGTKRRYMPTDLTYQFMGYCWALGYNTLTAQQIGFQKTLPPEKKFLRYTFSYPQENLEEWRMLVIKRLLRWVSTMDAGDFLMNLDGVACTSYNRICPYYKYICKAVPGESREWNEQTKYLVGKPWSPWTRDEELDKILDELIK